MSLTVTKPLPRHPHLHEANDLPGVTNVVFAPLSFAKNKRAASTAKKLQNTQGFVSHSLKMVTAPVAFAEAIASGSFFILREGIAWNKISPALGVWLAFLAPIIVVTGLFIATFELIDESIGLHKERRFLNRLIQPLAIERCAENKGSRRTAKQLHEMLTTIDYKYFHVSFAKIRASKAGITARSELLRKKHNLVRRVHYWCADKIEHKITSLRRHLKTVNRSVRISTVKKTIALFEEMKTQVFKKIFVHALGITASLLTGVGLILTCILTSYIVTFIVSTVLATFFAVAREVAHRGLLEQPGWQLDLKKCLPQFLQWKA